MLLLFMTSNNNPGHAKSDIFEIFGASVRHIKGKFELYQDGVDYKGDYATSTYYKVNDVVKFGGTQYKVTTAHTSGGSVDDFDQSKMTAFVEGQEWQDSYSASTVYKKGDIVTYGGYTYIYVNAEEASGNTPTDNAYWDVITTGYYNAGEYSHGTPELPNRFP